MGKYQHFVGISLDSIIVDGYCGWKLSSGFYQGVIVHAPSENFENQDWLKIPNVNTD
jgi:hypothetical protein